MSLPIIHRKSSQEQLIDEVTQIERVDSERQLLFKKTFVEIPKKVIVENIFPFIKFTPNTKFSQFGYFSDDRERKVFPVFSSVFLYKDFQFKFLIDLSRTKTLMLDHFLFEKFKPLFIKYPKMNDMEILIVDSSTEFNDQLFEHVQLKNLKKLQLLFCKGVKGENWKEENVQELRTLHLSNVYNFNEEIIKKMPKLVNLYLVNLWKFTGTGFPSGFYDHLESLVLCDLPKLDESTFFKAHNFKSLQKLMLVKLADVTDTCFDLSYVSNVENLSIVKCSVSDKLFQTAGVFPNVRQLKVKKMGGVKGVKWDNSLVSHLEELIISSCPFTDAFFKEHEFQALKALDLFGVAGVSGSEWEESLEVNLDKFRIYKCEKFCDQGMRFHHLHTLILGHVNCVYFSDWRTNLEGSFLRYLQIDCCDGCTDEFFEKNTFLVLKEMLLLGLKNVGGKKWSPMPVLKRLELQDCSSIRDPLFQESQWELKTLYLEKMSGLEGKDWKFFRNLNELTIRNCSGMTDGPLQDHKFAKLEKLEIYDCPAMTGKSWQLMRRLERLEVFFCLGFSDETFSKNVFPYAQNIRMAGLGSIDTSKWIWGFGNLRKIFIEGNFYKDFSEFKKNPIKLKNGKQVE